MSICFIYFLLFLILSLIFFLWGICFLLSEEIYFLELNLFNLNSVSVEMCILLDWMSLIFMSLVLFISSMVIFYSTEYMSSERDLNRFILLVVMFVISMMMLIISPNLISILLGWDGLGLVSYCLVIYYQNIKSFNAGMLTALSNRVGDVALLLSIAWMLNYGSWNFIFYLDYMKEDYFMKIVGSLVLIAAMTKSAQIPFSSWLPAAMAAPTPVSALVHSSTLVTAGVYLLIRFNLVISENFSNYLLFFSLITMFMAGLGANFEYDLKKIIALSTLSQLGLMMSILSLGDEILAFYHLLIHALFKALLFMCAGNLIHNLSNCQDIRFMGSIFKQMPLTLTYFNISNFSLCGLPFFSGFYSKDLMVEMFSFLEFNYFVYILMYLSIGLTVSYSFRLSYFLMVSNFNFFSLNMTSDNINFMLKSMTFMMVFVIFSGSSLNWLIFKTPYFIILPSFMKLVTLIIISMGMVLGFEVSKMEINYILLLKKNMKILSFFSLMWNLPYLSTYGLNFLSLKMGFKMEKFLDQGWVEYFGSQNLFSIFKSGSSLSQYFFKVNLKIYLFIIFCWLFMVLFYFLI